MAEFAAGRIGCNQLNMLYANALADTIARFEQTGSTVITDGEQTKPSFVTYAIDGLESLDSEGVAIPFADGHIRQLPRLTGGPFRYRSYAGSYVAKARTLSTRNIKQSVIAPSALSLLYPADGIDYYAKDEFVDDLLDESEKDIRSSFTAGAYTVQLDFTEGRLSLKLDPSKKLLRSFVELNNRVLERFTAEERSKLGVHTCPGGDFDSVHSLDVDYAELLPDLFSLKVGNFYLQLASERNRRRVLEMVMNYARPNQRIFIGVIDPINPRVETAENVRDRVLEAAEYVPAERLGTCDDCGFAPFSDDTSTSRDTAFSKISARVVGTHLAADKLGI